MDYYLAESYRELETVGDIYEKNGKEYITVILKSGREHAARVYRPVEPKPASTSTLKSTHAFYDLYTELGFNPKSFIYLVHSNEEDKLQGICRWHPAFGAYLTCNDDICELPFGCKIKQLYWIDVCDRTFIHLKPIEEIKSIIDLI